ncbi:hypothetical protein [Pseudoflavonifractor phocaeensis]|uniref:hypothetical protein n=1 Tax=Pseudoflavonifractor phocaeensis TaxID=1870988 RepID=UPI00210D09AA|nr:hypothetical protein [Pseudoflavonifractor phocaeensis]MCQ4864426.1 hypothetical protein [Pseudoflavonifractor phocaeensis]
MQPTPVNALTKKRHRNLGFDLFRFWGVFLIFVGHNYGIFQGLGAELGLSNLIDAPTWWAEFGYSSFWYQVVLTGVPLFIMIAGFHSLGRPCGPNDWVKAKSDFCKYVLFWFKWLIVGTLLAILVPSIWGRGVADLTFTQKIEVFIENLFCTNITKGFAGVTAINWTTLGLAWAALLCFLLRPLFQSKNIKAIRAMTFVVFFMVSIVPTIYTFGKDMLVQHPDSMVALFFSNFNPLSTTGWNPENWNNFWFPMLMLGGWYAVDTDVRKRVQNMSWPKTLAICAVMVIAFVFIAHYYGMNRYVDGMFLTIYWRGGWAPASFAWFILADKINATCKEDSKLGRFILKFGEDNIGGMIISYPFGSTLQQTVFFFVYEWMFATFHSPVLLSLMFFLYNAAFYAVLVTIVHFLRPVFSKIPVLRGLLYWDKIKIFDKEKVAVT